jgi:hypothetical protein
MTVDIVCDLPMTLGTVSIFSVIYIWLWWICTDNIDTVTRVMCKTQTLSTQSSEPYVNQLWWLCRYFLWFTYDCGDCVDNVCDLHMTDDCADIVCDLHDWWLCRYCLWLCKSQTISTQSPESYIKQTQTISTQSSEPYENHRQYRQSPESYVNHHMTDDCRYCLWFTYDSGDWRYFLWFTYGSDDCVDIFCDLLTRVIYKTNTDNIDTVIRAIWKSQTISTVTRVICKSQTISTVISHM